MSILPTLQQQQQQSLLILLPTTEQIQSTPKQLEKIQQLQQQQQPLQQQQPEINLKMTQQILTRTRTSSSSIFDSLFEANYSNDHNPMETADLISEDFSHNPYPSSIVGNASYSYSYSSIVPSVSEEMLTNAGVEIKENTFEYPSFYETNTEVKNFDISTFNLLEENMIHSSSAVTTTTTTTISSPHSRDTSYSPSPSPSSVELSYSHSYATNTPSSILKGTASKSKVKKNRGTPPKPVNASKEEMEKYFNIRSKNNLAASTSRKKKKEKEEENIKKLEFLKKENEQLRILLDQCKHEAASLHEELQSLIKNFKKD